MDYYLVGDFEGVPLVRGDGYLPSPTLINFPDGRKAIAVNGMEKFKDDELSIAFILYHELGHLANGDSVITSGRLIRELLCNLVGKAAREELLADAYAINRMGISIEQYEQIVRSVHFNLVGQSLPVRYLVNGRIRSIRKKYGA